jgi:hypothetical protein
MKKLIVLFTVLLCIGLNSYSQNWPKIWVPANVSKNINGGNIVKGDTVDVIVEMNRNYNDQEPTANKIRSLLFDFENQDDAFKLVQTIVPPIGTGAIPNTAWNIATNYYPHYSWHNVTSGTSANNTTNGNTNYKYAQYDYNPVSVQKITRITLNVNADLNNGVLFILRFIVQNTKAGYSYNPLKMNFVAGFTNTSGRGGTIMTNQVCPFVLDPVANSLLTLKVETNSNLATNLLPKVYVGELAQDGVSQVDSRLFDIASDGTVNVDQAWLKVNTKYFLTPFAPLDSVYSVQRKAITVSDFTSAQNEFINANLDGTYSNSNMVSGVSYYAANADANQVFDAADVNRIFATATGAGYLIDSVAGAWNNSVFTFFTDSMYNNLKSNNWNTLSFSRIDFKTTALNQNMNLKYAVLGDINRSHASQVVNSLNQIITNAKNSLRTNNIASSAYGYVNTPNAVAGIDVSLNNATITSNNIEIPFSIDTKGNNASALQFEVVYDPSAIKFEEIKSQLPNTWFVFVNPESGRIRFGAVDKDLKFPINGASVPFKLVFSSIGNGLDLLSQIKVTESMDASDEKGNQLGINLNTTIIKLTGYNNF